MQGAAGSQPDYLHDPLTVIMVPELSITQMVPEVKLACPLCPVCNSSRSCLPVEGDDVLVVNPDQQYSKFPFRHRDPIYDKYYLAPMFMSSSFYASVS